MGTRTKKFYLRVTIVLLIFVVVTIGATFFGIDLPWTAHRASAVKMPTYDYDEYEWFEENGLYIRDEQLESALWEHIYNLFDLTRECDVYMTTGTVTYGKWIEVGIQEDDFILGRAILYFYAKWYNVSIFYWIDEGAPVLQ